MQPRRGLSLSSTAAPPADKFGISAPILCSSEDPLKRRFVHGDST